ncbi:MAG: hypothetical protein ACREBR_00515, partial [bacterium]
GNDFEKDYVGAINAGFRAVLLDRFDEHFCDGNGDSVKWKQAGVPVFKDLIDVVEYLAAEGYELG